jgi:alpha-D-xyloside xylohydrolase
MLGDDLLVAPVFTADGTVEYYVPDGEWTHLLSGERIPGPGWRRERYGFDSLPLLVRAGAVLPYGERDGRADYDWAHGVTLRAYRLADGTTVTTRVPRPADASRPGEHTPDAVFRTRRHGRRITAESTGAPGPWHLLLVGTRATVDDGAAATAEHTDEGTLLTAPHGTTELTALLAEGESGN